MGSYVTTYFHKRHLLLRYFRWKQGTMTKHPTRSNTAPQPLVKAWPPLKLEPPCLKVQSRSGLMEVGICSTGHSAWRAREMHQSWVSWRSVHWCQPSALAAFCTRKSKQTPKHHSHIVCGGMWGLLQQQLDQPQRDRVTHQRGCGRPWWHATRCYWVLPNTFTVPGMSLKKGGRGESKSQAVVEVLHQSLCC